VAFKTSQFFILNLSQCIASGFLEPPILETIHSVRSQVRPPSSANRVILFCDYHQQFQNVKRLESVLPWKVACPNQHLNFISTSSKIPLDPITQSRHPPSEVSNSAVRIVQAESQLESSKAAAVRAL